MNSFFWVTEGAKMISQSFMDENLSLSSLSMLKRSVVAVLGIPIINTGALTVIFLYER